MYYEEAIINGVLCSRVTPDGEFVPMEGLKEANVVNALLLLNDAARAEVFDLFCAYCGKADQWCQCWNDG